MRHKLYLLWFCPWCTTWRWIGTKVGDALKYVSYSINLTRQWMSDVGLLCSRCCIGNTVLHARGRLYIQSVLLWIWRKWLRTTKIFVQKFKFYICMFVPVQWPYLSVPEFDFFSAYTDMYQTEYVLFWSAYSSSRSCTELEFLLNCTTVLYWLHCFETYVHCFYKATLLPVYFYIVLWKNP